MRDVIGWLRVPGPLDRKQSHLKIIKKVKKVSTIFGDDCCSFMQKIAPSAANAMKKFQKPNKATQNHVFE